MFHKILAAIDRSEIGQEVFHQAVDLASATGASLTLLNVLSSEEEECPHLPVFVGHGYYLAGLSRSVVDIYEELWQNYVKRGLEILQSLADKASVAGVCTDFTQSLGSPGQEICAVARDRQVDLIIVGRRGNRGLNEIILGSASNYVLHYAPCSVLTVQHRFNRSREATSIQQASVPQE